MLRTSIHPLVVLMGLSISLLQGTDPGAGSRAAQAIRRAPSGPAIDWVSGPAASRAQSPAAARDALQALVAEQSERHVVVQFQRPLERAERATVRAAGVELLSYLGSNAWFAAASAQSLEASLLAGTPLLDVRAIERSWKLHPMLERDEVPSWSVVEAKDQESPVVGAYVIFHPDVPLGTEAAAVLQRHGALLRDTVESVHAMVVELPFASIKPLADEDAVQYIEPPLPRLDVVNDSNRTRVGADTLQTAPYGLDGTGVTVLVYDGGTALSSHVDFGGRATVRDASGTHYHSTHVAATVGGDGSASSGQYRGMAPGVTIESYGFEYDGSGTFLYTNPGDFEDDYGEAITLYGADIGNNSIGSNVEPNGFPCAYQGDYGLMSSLIDGVVRGSVSGGTPFRIVWAAGNERQGSSCDIEGYGDYYSTAPPATAKNHIAVGALNSNDDSMTTFSSWGPTDDGRLKPDVSGPGCQSNVDNGVTSATSTSSTSYTALCGTSMASPTVAGIAALMLQDYRLQYGGPDPRNSTLKVLLAHTAEDLGNTGPDYQFGYGSVRAVEAVDFQRSGNFAEDAVDQGGVLLYTVGVGASDPELRVTLAWDDFPAVPNVGTALVNDVDLHVFSPSGVEAFPWTLDPLNPSAPAIQSQHDTLNNIEQVYVPAPEPGVWLIEIRGASVPQGPQPVSLAASPNLLSCASQGVMTLDSGSYACNASATVVVIDCDLNTDDGLVETVDVTVSSTSEPGGEVLTLTETGPETSAFSATIALDGVGGVGALLVAEGDSVDAVYVDADDGQGGTNVPVPASAGVDCSAPTVTAVNVSGIGPQSASVQVDVDEATTARLSYGTSCGALNQSAASLALTSSHTFQLSGLVHGTTYFFQVLVEDEAGNTTLSDGGSCHGFETLDVPDYFTEQFESHDLDHTTVTYHPVGSFEAYRACASPAGGFPSDPAGSTTLIMTDDDSELVVVGGGQMVHLYGVAYDRFYVGSNGYITFGATDGDYTESLVDHFDLPRISANFDDYNPASAGSISWKQLGNRMVVTWSDVPEYSTSNQNSFQVELFFDGRIRITCLDVASADGIGGLSAGAGVPSPFIESDLSAYECVLTEAGPRLPR